MIRKKIIILGGFAVGKTSLLNRYVLNEFSHDYIPTIGVNIKTKNIQLNEKDIELIIWDIADVVTLNTIPVTYLKGTHAAVLVFDVARESSFKRISDDLEGMKKVDPNIETIVIGNKTDLVKQSYLQEIESGLSFKVDAFTSVLKNENVEEIFIQLTNKLIF